VQGALFQAEAMKASTAELKNQMKKVNLSELEDVMDDMSDLLEDTNEMNEVRHITPLDQHPYLTYASHSLSLPSTLQDMRLQCTPQFSCAEC
jgi:hypothetical protein